MGVVPDKYRGTAVYRDVYRELINAVRYKGTVTYQELAQMMGLPISGQHMGNQVGWILGEISEDKHLAGRPMLSAVAVGVSGEPGEGFYKLAKDMGILGEISVEEQRKFWKKQREAVYEAWKRVLVRSEPPSSRKAEK
jgi:alkylated DNA nucleotide flippase Atl1